MKIKLKDALNKQESQCIITHVDYATCNVMQPTKVITYPSEQCYNHWVVTNMGPMGHFLVHDNL